jgi:acetoin utilization deacetylase AcuC-like enzyme
MIGVYVHGLFLRHLEGYPHVERPDRLRAVFDRLQKEDIRDKLEFVEAIPAEKEWIYRIHARSYVEEILSLQVESPRVLDWGDTVATEATPQAALFAAGAGVQAVRDIMAGRFSQAFCAVRPPGHHAEFDRAMGFCLFNNIAVAAADLRDHSELERIAIVDWDVHHGNGTEHAFNRDPRVLFISLHQFPHYPGSGAAKDRGEGKGEGYTLNIPMVAGSADEEYRRAFTEKIVPALDTFQPQFVLISAGFDGHTADPLSSIELSTQMYGEMTEMIVSIAREHCEGKLVSFLEGGYDLHALADSVASHIAAMRASR